MSEEAPRVKGSSMESKSISSGVMSEILVWGRRVSLVGLMGGLTATEMHQLPDFDQGEGLWRVNQRALVIRHICTPSELKLSTRTPECSINLSSSKELASAITLTY